MRFREAFCFLVVLVFLGACGPGAAKLQPIPAAEAEFDLVRGVMWQKPEHVGRKLQGEWRCSKTCSTNSPASPDHLVDETRSTFGSKGDLDTGSIAWIGTVPEGVSVVAIPVAGGRSDATHSIYVTVGFGPTFKLRRPPDNWRYWRVYVNSGGSKKMTIRASDRGSALGEWVAIGTPRAIE